MLSSYIGVDSSLPDNFGRSVMYGLSAVTTLSTVSVVGGPPFILAIIIICTLYYNGECFLEHIHVDTQVF